MSQRMGSRSEIHMMKDRPMQVPTALLTLLCVSIAMAAQPPELAEMGKKIVP